MDILSEVLGALRLTGGVFLDSRFTAPWCVASRIGPEDCRPFIAEPKQLVAYHFVIEGRMIAGIPGGESVEVKAGEAVLLARNDPHLLGSSLDLPAVSADDLVRPPPDGGLPTIDHGGGGAPTRMFCGWLATEQHGSALLQTLPRVLTVDMTEAGSAAWMEASLRLAVQGLCRGAVGTATVISRLSEVMFVEAVRRYAARLGEDQRGWLAGLRDPHVGRALALIHARPEQDWTTEMLAGAVALSRSAFADRFIGLVGAPPMRYVTSWRMQLAKERLRAGGESVARIAYAVGYEAEAAFIRAFKREVGLPPAAWRRQTHEAEVSRPGRDNPAPSVFAP